MYRYGAIDLLGWGSRYLAHIGMLNSWTWWAERGRYSQRRDRKAGGWRRSWKKYISIKNLHFLIYFDKQITYTRNQQKKTEQDVAFQIFVLRGIAKITLKTVSVSLIYRVRQSNYTSTISQELLPFCSILYRLFSYNFFFRYRLY